MVGELTASKGETTSIILLTDVSPPIGECSSEISLYETSLYAVMVANAEIHNWPKCRE